MTDYTKEQDDRDERIRELESEITRLRETLDHNIVERKKACDERDELERQMDTASGRIQDWVNLFNKVQAKCPPDDVLAALRHVCLWDDDVPLKPLIDAYNAWQSSKTAPKDDRECGASKYADMANKYNNADRALSRLLTRLGFDDVEYALAEIDGLEAERDELKRQLDVVTNELMALKHTHEKCQYIEHGFVRMVEAAEAKCPPDDVLSALTSWAQSPRPEYKITDKEERFWAAYRAWQASKTAPDGVEQFKNLLHDLAENPAPEDALLREWSAPEVDKTKPPGYGDCSICEYFDTPHNEPPCESCIHAVGAAIDNWTPKEGVK